MRKNRKRKTILHSAMRQNAMSRAGGRRPLVVAALAALVAALSVGGYLAYSRLRAIWMEQCVLTDVERQVTVSTGTNIKPGLILDQFGLLKKGANLAEIDFEKKRNDILHRIPNIRSLTVSRHLPDRLEIVVEEREPIARMKVRGSKGVTGRVVDAEGVVFVREAGTSLLPVIYEAKSSFTAAGKTLSGRAAAALRMLEACRMDKDLAGLGIVEVYTHHLDYLIATLDNYSLAKIAWEGMDAPTAGTDDLMLDQLRNFCSSKRTAAESGATVKVWNVTLPGIATADTKEPIL